MIARDLGYIDFNQYHTNSVYIGELFIFQGRIVKVTNARGLVNHGVMTVATSSRNLH